MDVPRIPGLCLDPAYAAGSNRTGSARRAGPHVRVLRFRPKVRKLAAEVEGRQADGRRRCAFPPSSSSSLPASHPAAAPHRKKPEESAEERARRGLSQSPPPRGASSRSQRTVPTPWPSLPCRDRGKFTNTNPGPVSPEVLPPPPRPLSRAAISTSGLGAWTGGSSQKGGEAEDAGRGGGAAGEWAVPARGRTGRGKTGCRARAPWYGRASAAILAEGRDEDREVTFSGSCLMGSARWAG
ncbi:translation initiation factor IF-2-like [Herpailurus yagouaroundi]|uniref:translation initiation factor IF-2-like n=1 Tax=Herpailurus yagouaroundi TaxID=1608482 RepID=UPI001AD700C4|nr:translation initiation factor IF-2-like [Puma yagouaroundi]